LQYSFFEETVPIYKIGRTNKKNFKRFEGYPKDVKILLFRTCNDCAVCEQKMIDLFNDTYVNYPQLGREFFIGNVQKMIMNINAIVDHDYNSANKDSKEEKDDEKKYKEIAKKIRENKENKENNKNNENDETLEQKHSRNGSAKTDRSFDLTHVIESKDISIDAYNALTSKNNLKQLSLNNIYEIKRYEFVCDVSKYYLNFNGENCSAVDLQKKKIDFVNTFYCKRMTVLNFLYVNSILHKPNDAKLQEKFINLIFKYDDAHLVNKDEKIYAEKGKIIADLLVQLGCVGMKNLMSKQSFDNSIKNVINNSILFIDSNKSTKLFKIKQSLDDIKNIYTGNDNYKYKIILGFFNKLLGEIGVGIKNEQSNMWDKKEKVHCKVKKYRMIVDNDLVNFIPNN
jgi:hypothetical protein